MKAGDNSIVSKALGLQVADPSSTPGTANGPLSTEPGVTT